VLGQANDKIGQQDEMKGLLQITESLKSDVNVLKKVTADKETQVRTLQSEMGQMQAENSSLNNKDRE
jgi:hypothetical protein